MSLFIFTSCIGDKEPQIKKSIEKKETPSEKSLTKKIEREEIKSEEVTTVQFQNENIESQEEIKLRQAVELYLGRLKSLDIDSIINMTYPKFFIVINKEIFREYINTLVTSEDLTISSFETTLNNIGYPTPYSKGLFSQPSYISTITISFINPELYSTERKMRFLANIMQEKYGEENIQIDAELRTITIKKEERLLAIKENGRWSFIGDNPEYRRLYPKFLPIDILNQI